MHVHLTNTSNLPVEALETEYPLVLERYELVDGSGGAGKYRGGMGLFRQVRIEDHECRTYIFGSRFKTAPWGLDGGQPGAKAHFDYTNPGEAPNNAKARLDTGSCVSIVTPGAGGYGPPGDRDPALVRRDLADEKISADIARQVYGLKT